MMQALGDLYSNAPGCNQLQSSQLLDGECTAGAPTPADSENYYHDTIVQRYFIGSGGGLNQLCKQGLAGVSQVDVARSSRVPLGTDCTGLHFVGYARDAITWEGFPGKAGSDSAPIFGNTGTLSLTTAQLKNIFVNCTVTNWNQVGGTSGAITVYVPQANSGTGVTWAAAMGVSLASGQALDNCIPAGDPAAGTPGSHKSPENTNSLILANGDAADAIFPFSVGVYENTINKTLNTQSPDGSELGKINGKSPTFGAIQGNTFPVSRYLWNVYCAAATCGTASKADAQVQNFASENGFLCTDLQDSSNNNFKDPLNGQVYRTPTSSSVQPLGEIPATIKAKGFVPLKNQNASGTANYCHVATT
jgi:hypothetical protein